jgi:hypothetical protein
MWDGDQTLIDAPADRRPSFIPRFYRPPYNAPLTYALVGVTDYKLAAPISEENLKLVRSHCDHATLSRPAAVINIP